MAEAPVIEVAEPFTEYSALLDVQMDLYMGLRTASPDQVVGLWEDITGVDQDLIQLAAQPGLVQSALRCGMVLAHEVDILRKDRAAEPATNKAARDTYGHQLGQIAAL